MSRQTRLETLSIVLSNSSRTRTRQSRRAPFEALVMLYILLASLGFLAMLHTHTHTLGSYKHAKNSLQQIRLFYYTTQHNTDKKAENLLSRKLHVAIAHHSARAHVKPCLIHCIMPFLPRVSSMYCAVTSSSATLLACAYFLTPVPMFL